MPQPPPRTVRIDPASFRSLRAIRRYESQTALAVASGVDQSTISRMNRLPGPYEVAKVRAVAKAFGVEDLRVLGVPDEDARALEDEESAVARFARKHGFLKSGERNRVTGQDRPPRVAALAARPA